MECCFTMLYYSTAIHFQEVSRPVGMAWYYGLNRLSENQVCDATVCRLIRNKATRFQPSSICRWSLSTTPSDTLVYNLMRKFGS